jgi:hypothetical protein
LQQSAALVTAGIAGVSLLPTFIAAVSSTQEIITMRAIFILKLHDA